MQDAAESELQRCRLLLDAIGDVQQHLSPATKQSEAVASVLANTLRLCAASAGLLAFVRDNEPCRIHDSIDDDQERDRLLGRMDALARDALEQRQVVVSKDCAALPLAVGRDIYAIAVVSGCVAVPIDLADWLHPFTVTSAAVLRQFQEDLSTSQVGAVIDQLTDAILSFDDHGRIVSMNAAAEQVFGFNADDIEGRLISRLVAEPFATELERTLIADGVLQVNYPGREFEGRRRDGSVFPMEVSLSQLEVQGKNLFLALARDMTEIKAREREAEKDRADTATLKQLARIDPVTGIANRRYFDESLEKEIRRAARDQQPLGLILCDIDFFKAFNDRYGHPAGDKALKSVAEAIDSSFKRAGELAARYGGEEFGVVVARADLDTVARLAAKLHQRVGQLQIPHGASPVAATVSLSIGVASAVPGPHFDPMELVKEADRALYRAKGSGRNRVVISGDAEQQRRLRAL